jgi:mannose-1-phosphate guanylyltransferase
MIKAVILIGGPQKGTRFRPLSFDLPKPLFPVAGYPIIYHHIYALSQVESVKEIFLMGFFQPTEDLTRFVANAQSEFKMPIRYLQEYKSLGTGGGIYHFRDVIKSGNPSAIFIINGDTAGDFPLNEMLNFHTQKRGSFTILSTEATENQSVNYGCMVADKISQEVLHYVEKPERYLSSLINCGIYLFSLEIFDYIREELAKNELIDFYYTSNGTGGGGNGGGRDLVNLETTLFPLLASTKKFYAFKTERAWSSIKSAGSAIYANRLYLELYKRNNPSRLAQNGAQNGPRILGDVFIHPSATVDPSATLGPNVSIGFGVTVGPGVRVRESIILGNTILQSHSCILYSIIGWNSVVGAWARVEGTPSDPDPNKAFAKIEHQSLFTSGKLNPSITIIGSNVTVPREIIVRNSIILPHKELQHSYKNEIFL